MIALARWGVARVIVQNRSADGRRRFRHWLERQQEDVGVMDIVVEALPAAGTTALPEGGAIWICCLPGGVDIAPWLPVATGQHDCLLLDLRYREQVCCSRRPLGMHVIDGEPVLLLQGGLSFTWWFGPPVPWPALRNGLAAC